MQLQLSVLRAQGDTYRHAAMLDASTAETDVIFEFGRFRVLPRRRQLLADGVPVELHTRAFDLLLVLLEADGRPVTKDELLHRVWPGVAVVEKNLHVQICALRKALGGDRNLIGTDFGRGYRFTTTVRSVTETQTSVSAPTTAWKLTDGGDQLIEVLNRIATLVASGEAGKPHSGLEVVVRLLPMNSTEDSQQIN
jgi:DNA-binding winged helix-turn-helix (wHTH) protein